MRAPAEGQLQAAPQSSVGATQAGPDTPLLDHLLEGDQRTAHTHIDEGRWGSLADREGPSIRGSSLNLHHQASGRNTNAQLDALTLGEWQPGEVGRTGSEVAFHGGAQLLHLQGAQVGHSNPEADSTTQASADDIAVHRLQAQPSTVGIDRSGLSATTEGVAFTNTSARGLGFSHDNQDTQRRIDGGLAELDVHQVQVDDALAEVGTSGIHAAAEGVGFTNVAARDGRVGFDNRETGRSASAAFDAFTAHELEVGPSTFDLDGSGLHASSEQVGFTNLAVDDLALRVGNEQTGRQAGARADRLAAHQLDVGPSTFDVDGTGLHAASEGVDFTNLAVEDAQLGYRNRQTGREARFGADQVVAHQLGIDQASLDVDSDGMRASAARVEWLNTHLSRADLQLRNTRTGNGVGARVDQLDVHALSGDDLSLQSNVLDTEVRGSNLSWQSVNMQGAQATADLGRAGARLGADAAAFLEVSAGKVAVDLKGLIVAGELAVEDVVVTLLELDQLGAEATWDGQTLVGATADVAASLGARSAEARWDVAALTAGASVEGFRAGAELRRSRLNVLGRQIDIPDLAVEVLADATATADLTQGAVAAALNLAGSQIEVGDTQLVLPEWAQAGVDVNVAEGQLDLNIGGHHIDVDEAISELVDEVVDLFDGDEEQVEQLQEGASVLDELAERVTSVTDTVLGWFGD